METAPEESIQRGAERLESARAWRRERERARPEGTPRGEESGESSREQSSRAAKERTARGEVESCRARRS